jgi:DNA-binding protein YbaB
MSNELKGLDALIASLQIFRKYGNPGCPTHCEHDEMRVMIDPNPVSAEDKKILEDLHWSPEKGNDCFLSFYYGSA